MRQQFKDLFATTGILVVSFLFSLISRSVFHAAPDWRMPSNGCS